LNFWRKIRVSFQCELYHFNCSLQTPTRRDQVAGQVPTSSRLLVILLYRFENLNGRDAMVRPFFLWIDYRCVLKWSLITRLDEITPDFEESQIWFPHRVRKAPLTAPPLINEWPGIPRQACFLLALGVLLRYASNFEHLSLSKYSPVRVAKQPRWRLNTDKAFAKWIEWGVQQHTYI
jgi:hypothetical protein